MLLKAYDPEPPEDSPDSRKEGGEDRRTEFAAKVFQAAGKPILPVLIKALRVRSRGALNAARGCGRSAIRLPCRT